MSGTSIQSDPSGPRDTRRRAINKTDSSTDFIIFSEIGFFVSEAVLLNLFKEVKNNLNCCCWDILYGLAIKEIVKLCLIIVRVNSYQREIISYFNSGEDCSIVL